jgi:hypothetical protein
MGMASAPCKKVLCFIIQLLWILGLQLPRHVQELFPYYHAMQ